MTHTPTQIIDPTAAFGPDCSNLVTCAVRAVRRYLTRARLTGERKEFVIRQDLAYLGRHQLRDIGLDRDAL